MAPRQIPNLAPAVFVSPTAQIEIVQDGVTYRASAGQIAGLGGGGGSGTLSLTNDITDTVTAYPLFAKQTSGTLSRAYTSDPNYDYIPSEGRLSAMRVEAKQGMFLNPKTITLNYSIPIGDNAMSAGPVTVAAIITVTNGSNWTVV